MLGAAGRTSPVRAAEPPLCAAFAGVAEMRRIGRRWLALHPEEAAASRQWRDALNDAGRVCDDRVRRRVAESIRADLDRRDMVVLDGWVIPRTLARTCSALSLG